MIVTSPPRHGYKLIAGGRVIPAPTIGKLAQVLANAYRDGLTARARACVSVTRDRALSAEEQAELVELAAGFVVGR